MNRSRRRGVNAALVGIATGLVGAAGSRLVFGPRAAPIGVAVGGMALVLGTLGSWRLHGRRRPAVSLRIPRGLGLRRRVHPVDWIGPTAGSVITLAAWAGVAHSSGSGWVQAVGALLAAFLLVGLVTPAWTAHRIRLVCTGSPRDVTAGEPFDLTVECNRPARLRPVWPTGAETQAGGGQLGTRRAVVTVTPGHRGLIDSVVVEAASSAPFGLVWWAREVELPLPCLVHVAPRSGRAADSRLTTDDAPGEAALRVPSVAGEPRGVRPYAPGDPRRAVHWPATSHAGALMVRESERPTDDPVHVELVLPDDPDEAEAEAERSLASVLVFLNRRRPVLLATREEDGRVVRMVTDQLELGRRLARAVPG